MSPFTLRQQHYHICGNASNVDSLIMADPKFVNHYAVLGISVTADHHRVRRAYRHRASQLEKAAAVAAAVEKSELLTPEAVKGPLAVPSRLTDGHVGFVEKAKKLRKSKSDLRPEIAYVTRRGDDAVVLPVARNIPKKVVPKVKKMEARGQAEAEFFDALEDLSSEEQLADEIAAAEYYDVLETIEDLEELAIDDAAAGTDDSARGRPIPIPGATEPAQTSDPIGGDIDGADQSDSSEETDEDIWVPHNSEHIVLRNQLDDAFTTLGMSAFLLKPEAMLNEAPSEPSQEAPLRHQERSPVADLRRHSHRRAVPHQRQAGGGIRKGVQLA